MAGRPLGVPNKSRMLAKELAAPGALKAFMALESLIDDHQAARKLRDDPHPVDAVEARLAMERAPSDDTMIAAAKLLLAYAHGRPPEKVEIGGDGEDGALNVRISYK